MCTEKRSEGTQSTHSTVVESQRQDTWLPVRVHDQRQGDYMDVMRQRVGILNELKGYGVKEHGIVVKG